MQLEDEQRDLLAKFVEAHRSAPRESRGAFITSVTHNEPHATFFHSLIHDLRFQGSLSDAETLAHAGLLRMSQSPGGAVTFSVLPLGIEVYEQSRAPSLPAAAESSGKYTYEFDDTTVGELRLEYDEYRLLHAAYEALHSEVANWNQRAKAAGAGVGPYEREEADLARRIRWGEEQLTRAEPRWDPIVVEGMSIGSLRYAKAALLLLQGQLLDSVERKRREGWPDAAARSSAPHLPIVGRLLDRIEQDPSDLLWEVRPRLRSASEEPREWDVFISHAHEDKSELAEPLARRLEEQGLTVWYDTATLKLGMSLRRSIDAGLAKSRFGVVILSPSFLRKQWPQKELDGLVTLETQDGRNRVLPVWHKLTAEDVRRYSPTLADKVGISSDLGLDAVTDAICEAVRS